MKKAVCFGEFLWDVLPDERKPGGAPMNVAYHLHKLGISVRIVTAVGDDEKGEALIQFLNDIHLPSEDIIIENNIPTGEAIATISNNNEMSYEIIEPVAWDFIPYDASMKTKIDDADIFIFGSLVCRSQISRKTLYQLLETKTYKFFDVNFRPPHYTKEAVEYLLRATDGIKLNEHELKIIAGWLGKMASTEQEIVSAIMNEYNIHEMVLTKGANGASYFTFESRHDFNAYSVKVKDTIGSGDSFLAAFISQKLKGSTIEDTMNYASALGAFVTTQRGANPSYSHYDLNHFIWQKSLE